MVVKTTIRRVVALELDELSDQFKRSLKDELLDTADKKHKEAKKKKKKISFKDFQATAKAAKKKVGVRFYDKKGKGYIVKGKKKYD